MATVPAHIHRQLRTDVLSCLDVLVHRWIYYKWLTWTPPPSHAHPKIQGLICACVLPPVQNVCLVRLSYVKLYTETVVLMCQWFPFHWHGRTTKRSSTHNFRSSSKIDKVSCAASPCWKLYQTFPTSLPCCRVGPFVVMASWSMWALLWCTSIWWALEPSPFAAESRSNHPRTSRCSCHVFHRRPMVAIPWQLILWKIGGWSGFLWVFKFAIWNPETFRSLVVSRIAYTAPPLSTFMPGPLICLLPRRSTACTAGQDRPSIAPARPAEEPRRRPSELNHQEKEKCPTKSETLDANLSR